MNFTLNTRDHNCTVNGKKEIVKVAASITLNVGSHPAGKDRLDESKDRTAAAGLIINELRAAHGIDSIGAEAIASLVKLDGASALTATESAALLRARDLLIYADKLVNVTLTASALSLALQGVGPNAQYITNAVRKAVRSYLLLDSID